MTKKISKKRLMEIATFHNPEFFRILEDGEERFADDEIFVFYPSGNDYHCDWRPFDAKNDSWWANSDQITRRHKTRTPMSLMDERCRRIEQRLDNLEHDGDGHS